MRAPLPSPRLLAMPLLLSVLSLAAAVAADSVHRQPNVIIIMADDLGWGDLGCYGGTAIPTPHLDRLAASGRRFTQAYAPSSTCTPSRYAMLTGEYPWRQPPRRTAILDGDAPLALDPNRSSLALFLRNQGYRTALIGKWHLGLGDGVNPVDFNGHIAPGPLECGFSEAFFIPATVDRVPCVFIENHRVSGLDAADPLTVSYVRRVGDDPVGHERPDLLKYPADRQHADTIVNGISRIGHMAGGRAARWVDEEITDVLAGRTADFISRARHQPFFLLLGTHDPHVPRAPHPRFRGQSQAGLRGDSIVQLDWLVGEVLAALERAGVADHTLVLFTSDNGPVLFDGYFDGANETNAGHKPAGPWRGWKYLRYEGGTRVPLLARWPGRIEPGSTGQALVSLLDFFPTIAAATGQPYPGDAGRDGRNLLAALTGETDTGRDEIVLHGIGNVVALRQERWKFIPANADTATGIGRGANAGDARFSQARSAEDQLFDLLTDPGETTNLAAAQPEIAARLRARLGAIQAAPAHP